MTYRTKDGIYLVFHQNSRDGRHLIFGKIKPFRYPNGLSEMFDAYQKDDLWLQEGVYFEETLDKLLRKVRASTNIRRDQQERSA